VIIVDDESLARLRLSQLCDDIQADCDNTVIAQYAHATALMNNLPSLQVQFNVQSVPTVLLLDVNMPGLNGIEVANFLKAHAPYIHIIFVTAEPQHALLAFDVSAVDYVLKPVRADRLLAAFKKVLQLTQSVVTTAVPYITVHIDSNTTTAIPITEVIYFKADSKTTLVRTATDIYTCNLSLGELEQSLNASEQRFIRIHRNALVNRLACGQLNEKDDCTIQILGLKCDEFLQVSRRMLPSLRDSLLK
jgi:two-component system, LytTR family, response regulator AlgR